MAEPIEDYALLSDLATGPLVSRRGSIDWLCFPRFDSPSVFGALLGTAEHGRWVIAPEDTAAEVVARHYMASSFVLETIWQTSQGRVKVIDFMPVGRQGSSLLRRVVGLDGVVRLSQEYTIRPEYGAIKPWMSRVRSSNGETLLAMAGPDAWALHCEPLPHPYPHGHTSSFAVSVGEQSDFELAWFPSYRPLPERTNFDEALQEALGYWTTWAENCRQDGPYSPMIKRSLLVLRALTHFETGGIVAAPTTSLPEDFGGSRNWDYRYCWLRDAALTLESMLTHGYESEALKWRDWLLRALAGDPEDMQIMYGIAGERYLEERVLEHLPGYDGAAPVRIGNAAASQYQADVVGEVMVSLERLRLAGGREDSFSWALQRALLSFVEKHFDDKDFGLWEMRGSTRYFTHSRVMMWAAFDCGVRAVRDHALPGPADHWAKLRDNLHEEILSHGFNQSLNTFTQSYGGTQTDAALLVLPQVGFLAYDDKHMLGTVARIENELVAGDGLLMRYLTDTGVDGLEPGEHPFLACSFWLVEQYARTGRQFDARKLMDKLVRLANELGLLSEEFDTAANRMAGNFPQAFSHLALVRAADAIHGVDRLSLAAIQEAGNPT
ncbi:glycoside hydrolase family 15 protein [Arthrobacter sp. ZGTC412]|uniref:glycoside hydrolase family 15 protein n=1 Tax=Arthrobacter sp. ZGTC412 TaxID=2058900 RepID=UPI000CE2CADD|nr:glycoside hydrolase family 15 protein [Arthrobacter sp. ZGTC412]